MAINVARIAKPIKIRRKIRQPDLFFGVSFIIVFKMGGAAVPPYLIIGVAALPRSPDFLFHAVKNFMLSVRGFGEKILGRPASAGSERSASSSFNHFCWSRNVIIISVVEDFAMTVCEPSCMETFATKIRIQTVASPVQIRRHGQMSSSQSLFEQQSNEVTKEVSRFCVVAAVCDRRS